MINDKISYYNAIEQLNKWTAAYEAGVSLVSDKEWDQLYFDVQAFEHDTDIISKDSPTQKVFFTTVSKLNKVSHEHPMLSLDKTKDLKYVKSFLGDNDYIAMLKMDGLTCSLTYEDGKLVRAETRGNGYIGEDVLHNALVISSIPKRICSKSRLVVDGEIISTYKNFENFQIEYKNPRNFASGSIRLLDSEECYKRKLTFVAWDAIEGLEMYDLLSDQLYTLRELGFTVVPFQNPSDDLERVVKNLKDLAFEYSYPIDGIVFKFNSKKYGYSLGATDHHFKNAIAYKFYDETYPTKLKTIEWTMGRTGVLTPVAIFDPINIEGAEISRASLHNISIMTQLLGTPYYDQKIEVYRSNQIIPQIYCAEKKTDNVKKIEIPKTCPLCGEPVVIKKENDSEQLYCLNANCGGRLINILDHFCGKKGLDIKGISKATLEKLIDWGWLNTFKDIYRLHEHKKEWITKEGFGEKSVENILKSIEESRNTELWRIIAAAGIPNIGTVAAKQLANYFKTYAAFRSAVEEDFDFAVLSDFGDITKYAILNFDYGQIDDVVFYALRYNPVEKTENNKNILNNLTFCITGKLHNFKNRAELKDKIELLGGKVTDSVSSKTKYLVNNDINSTSSKNNTAKKLGIPIITEDELLLMMTPS